MSAALPEWSFPCQAPLCVVGMIRSVVDVITDSVLAKFCWGSADQKLIVLRIGFHGGIRQYFCNSMPWIVGIAENQRHGLRLIGAEIADL